MVAAVMQEDWPQSDLESVEFCEICGSSHRSVLLDDLWDSIFRVAPGRWTLWHCDECGSAYLDPRPTRESIHVAYEAYYTHQASDDGAKFVRAPEGLVGSLRRRVRNVYLNGKYQHRLAPALPLNQIWARALGARGGRIAYNIRHLPAPAAKKKTLLDVGCGNGAFLQIAKTLGYRVEGLEPDPDAARVSVTQGFRVWQGTVPDTPLPEGAYSQITLSHVVEHLHSPKAAMMSLFRALLPGGRIWIQTPNIEAQGFAKFGRDWRGLEPPRHLCLFSPGSLERLLVECGFRSCQLLDPPKQVDWFYKQSACIRAGMSPYSDRGESYIQNLKIPNVNAEEHVVSRNPGVAETVTMIAYRPL